MASKRSRRELGINKQVHNGKRRRLLATGLESLEHRHLMAGLNLPSNAVIDPIPPAPPGGGGTPGVAPFPYSETFSLHTNAASGRKIYLDFDGHVTSNTPWNDPIFLPRFITPSFDLDGDGTSFNNSERAVIQRIWQRVAEDFAPFDVDVTTEYPGEEALIKRDTTDQNFGTRVAIGGTYLDWLLAPAGGVAFLESFNQVVPPGLTPFSGNAVPCFVFADTQADDEKFIAEAATHEAGHTLGLSHDDGITGAYYTGHGFGRTSWAPIMGVGYDKELVQWSQGDYFLASNFEDDLSIITKPANGISYRADDYGNSIATATPFQIPSLGTGYVNGLIERNTDTDWFAVDMPGGEYTFTVSTPANGNNLDSQISLWTGSGSLIALDDPITDTGAQITGSVPAGTYYVKIDGVGRAARDPDPLSPTYDGGYTDYGSLGHYTVAFSQTPGAYIRGTAYLDVSENGSRQANEPPAAGFTVFIDDIPNGRLDPNESSTVTDANGGFNLLTAPGVRNVKIVTPLGYFATEPRSGIRTVTVSAPSQIINFQNFGVASGKGSVAGTKYRDFNSNGAFDFGDVPMQDIWLFADLDNDGRISGGEPAGVTDANGRYTINNVPGGTWQIREVLPPGWASTGPAYNNFGHTVTIRPGDAYTGMDFFNTTAVDYGDAPDSYRTLAASGGPSAGWVSGFGLGTRVDPDPDGQPSDLADGDNAASFNDEDGITFLTPLTPGSKASIQVNVMIPTGYNAGYFSGWFDWNIDGDFLDAGEKMFNNIRVDKGAHTYTFDVPTIGGDYKYLNPTFARFRYSKESGMGLSGYAVAGEIEDYRVQLTRDRAYPRNDEFEVKQFSRNNKLDVLANDTQSSRGQLRIVLPQPDNNFSQRGEELGKVNGGRYYIIDNQTPNDPTDDVIGYHAPHRQDGFNYLSDSLTYQVYDGFRLSAPITVRIKLTPASTAAIAIDDTFTVAPNSTTALRVTANDVPATVKGLPQPGIRIDTFSLSAADRGKGTLTRNNNGTPNNEGDDYLVFKPASGVTNATIRGTYSVTGLNNTNNPQTANITIQVRQTPGQIKKDNAGYDLKVYAVGANDSVGAEQTSQLQTGKAYWAAITAEDTRDPFTYAGGKRANGVFGAFIDLLFDARYLDVQTKAATNASPTGLDVKYGPNYQNSTKTGFIPANNKGVVVNLGAASLLDELDDTVQFSNVVLFIKFVPKATTGGTPVVLFRSDPARNTDQQRQDTKWLNNTTAQPETVPLNSIDYLGSNAFTIVNPAARTSAATMDEALISLLGETSTTKKK